MRNLKLAIRTLFRTPFVTVVAIVSLALGIGATAAIFSLFNQMLLQPLPVQEPSRLVNLSAPGPRPGSNSCNQAGECDEVFSYPMFRDLEKAQTVFTGIAAHRLFGANLWYKGQTLSSDAMQVSGSYFPLLGLQPALGRLLTPGDDKVVGESRVVVLSYGYWQSRFGLSPAVLNDAITVNGQSLTIIGVAPRGFTGTTLGSDPAVFVPITLRGFMEPGFKGFDDRRSYWAYVFARLKPGLSMEQAQAAINGPYKAIINDVEAPLQTGMSDQTMKRFRARQIGLAEGLRGQSSVSSEAKGPLTLLLGVTGFVLLIACANIANLLLARAAARASEMAVRLSLGASRWQLISQLLTESLVLAALGGAAGLVVAKWTLDLIASILPDDASNMIQLTLQWPVLAFAAALTLGTGLLFGLFPAIHSTRPDLAPVLKGTSGQPSGTKAAARFRTSLATVQIALSMALLVAAGLFTRSLYNISRVDLGLKIDNLVTFGISPELNGYTPERSLVLFERLEDELAAVPGVTRVTSSLVPALGGSNWGSSVRVEGFKSGPDIDNDARFNEVSAGYFGTMGIPLIAGREFRRSDNLKAAKVAIVNEEFAKKFNLGRDAVGKLMGSGREDKLDTEIVGLVQNAKYSEVKGKIPPLFFRPVRAGRRRGAGVGLRAHIARPGGISRDASPRRRAARSQPPGREPADDAAAGARERVHGPVHQPAVGGLCLPRDAAGGGRALRRARLHCRAAHARDRAADGARRGAVARARHGVEAGGPDDDRRRSHRARRGDLAGAARRIAALRVEGPRRAGAGWFGRPAVDRGAGGRADSRASRVAGRSDAGTPLRVVTEPQSPWLCGYCVSNHTRSTGSNPRLRASLFEVSLLRVAPHTGRRPCSMRSTIKPIAAARPRPRLRAASSV